MTGLHQAVLLLLKMALVDIILIFLTSQGRECSAWRCLGLHHVHTLRELCRRQTLGMLLYCKGSDQKDGNSNLCGDWETLCNWGRAKTCLEDGDKLTFRAHLCPICHHKAGALCVNGCYVWLSQFLSTGCGKCCPLEPQQEGVGPLDENFWVLGAQLFSSHLLRETAWNLGAFMNSAT